jgi:hypothetical protein
MLPPSDISETPFSAEFQGIEAMLNSSDGVDWVCTSSFWNLVTDELIFHLGYVGVIGPYARRLFQL